MSTVNFNDTVPAPLAGLTNVKWQSDATGNISANLLLLPTATAVSADYTASPTDTYIVAIGATTTITLPAAPTPNQVLIIKNASATIGAPITINPNGKTILGTASFTLYFGGELCVYYYAPGNNWTYISSANGNWINWTPTITAAGGMTVSGVTISDATWQWVNTSTVNFKLTALFTLGGAASSAVYFSAPGVPVPAAFGAYPQPCWVQAPGDPTQGTQYYFRPDATQGFFMRTPSNVPFVLGAYNVSAQGFYRIA